MTGAASLFSGGDALPGWFGKLPGMGDFAQRRLPESFRAPWDGWLQGGLARLRLRHEDWMARYLEAPLGFFVLAQDLIGPRPWIGVLMPSVDGVGRYFPFTVAAELNETPSARAWPALGHWWQRAAQAALEGLEQDLDAVRFDSALARAFAHEAAELQDGAAPTWPAPGQSLWLTAPQGDGGPRLCTAGLPREARFDRLFGHGDADEAAPVTAHATDAGDAA